MRLTLLPFVLALSVLGSAQVSNTKTGYLFRVKYTKGQLMEYRMTAKQIAKKGPALLITSPFSMRVLSVTNGVAEILASEGPVMLNGKQFQPLGTAQGEMDSRFRPVNSDLRNTTFSGMYPERAIKVGQSWTTPFQLQNTGVTGKMVATYKLDRFSIVDGQRVAVLKTKIVGPLAGGGETMVRVSDGTPQRMVLTLGLTYAQPGVGTKESNVTIEFGVYRK